MLEKANMVVEALETTDQKFKMLEKQHSNPQSNRASITTDPMEMKHWFEEQNRLKRRKCWI